MKQTAFSAEYIKPTKIPFKNEEEISFSLTTKKQNDFIRKVKKIVQGEGMWYQVKAHTEMKSTWNEIN